MSEQTSPPIEAEVILSAIFAQHAMESTTQCGAVSIPVVHHHGSENDKRPGPKRVLHCTEPVGHEGDHKDAICCWHFQKFADWQVESRNPRAHDLCCSCHVEWPCPTVRAIQDASHG